MNLAIVRSLIASLLVLSLCSACQTPRTALRAPLKEEGEVFLYLKALEDPVPGLRFNIAAVNVVGSDGREYPLALYLPEVNARSASRQRLFASAVLPAGSYSGFTFKSGPAFRLGETGEVALHPADEPVRLDLPFSLAQREGKVISAALQARESVRDTDFVPLFRLGIPERPLTALAGYVTNYASNSISVFDKRSGEVLGVIPIGQGPRDMVLDQVSRRGYVSLYGEDAIAVIDLLNNQVLNRIVLNPGDRPQGLVLAQAGRTLLSVNTGSNSVSFIDPVSLQEFTRVLIGVAPGPMLLDPTGEKAYIFHGMTNSITILDVANRVVITTLRTEASPLWGQLSRQGDRLYVIHTWSPYMVVYDTRSLGVVRRVEVGIGVTGLKLDDATGRLFLTRSSDPMIEVYDPFSYMPVEFFRAAAPGAGYMLIDRVENNLLLLLPGQSALQGINLVSKKPVLQIDVGAQPLWVTIAGER